MRILFLAANPRQTESLDLEEELRSLEQELRGVKFRDSVILIPGHAVRPDDLILHVREHRPNIIHFSGHGSPSGIVLRDDTGNYQVVEGASLRRFLEGRGIDLVVFNACYSKTQADAIQGVVKSVVGTTDSVSDEAARRFTVAFYRSLGNGLPVREAFRDGGDAVALHGLIDVFHSGGDLNLTFVSEALNSSEPIRTRVALPEFTMIRLFSRNQPQDNASWNEIRDGEFQRNDELAADPVFDIMVENKTSNTLVLYRVGIRILQRKEGTGGTKGYPQPVEVQSEFRVPCPQEWKRTWGVIDDRRWTEFVAPIEMKKGGSPFRFTLMLENFCDPDSASSCEVKFYLVTGNGTAESRSIWLSQ